MAVTEYTYSIANDTVNGKVSDTLHIEIWDSSIVTALNNVSVDESQDLISIKFEDALSAGDKTLLDGIVSAHEGIELEPETSHVVVDNAIAIDKGTANFQTLISHDWTDDSTWPTTIDSLWMFEPSSVTKQIKMVKSEVQFSHDVQLGSQTPAGEFYFDIWVYNPLFDQGSAPTADNPLYVPGVTQGENPLRFLYNRTTFSSIRSVFDYGNDHFTMSASGVDGITTGVTTVKFNYDQAIILRGDQGAQVRFSLKDDNALGGDYCTVSVVVREEDIPS